MACRSVNDKTQAATTGAYVWDAICSRGGKVQRLHKFRTQVEIGEGVRERMGHNEPYAGAPSDTAKLNLPSGSRQQRGGHGSECPLPNNSQRHHSRYEV